MLKKIECIRKKLGKLALRFTGTERSNHGKINKTICVKHWTIRRKRNKTQFSILGIHTTKHLLDMYCASLK